MKKLLAIVLGGLTLLATGCDAGMNYNRVAANALDNSVVIHIKVKVKDSKGHERTGMAGCSGTYVDGDKILTAAHCFEYTPVQTWIRGVDGHSYPVEVIKLDAPHDLALLWVHGVHDHSYARIGHSPRVGDEIMNIGSPVGLEFLASKGIVSALDVPVLPFTSHYTVTDAMINPGSSGGGVFDKHGYLVGVNTMSVGFFGWAGISMAVSTEDVNDFLR